MIRKTSLLLSFALAIAAFSGGMFAAAAEMPAEDAWKALPAYEYGQDIAPLLAIDRAVITSMGSPEGRAACAARLAKLLETEGTTPAARQYICLQLRQVGTPAEVPLLARLLLKEESSEMARHALEAIAGEESLSALRAALPKLKGKLQIGIINSLAARKDAGSVAQFKSLADSQDGDVAAAALWALGKIANDEAAAELSARAAMAGVPTPQNLATLLLLSADAQAAGGKTEQARSIYERLSQAGQAPGVRRAALVGQLGLAGDSRAATILDWLGGDDADRRLVAAAQLASLSDEQLDAAAGQLGRLSAAGQRTLVEVLAARKGQGALPFVLELARSDNQALRLAGIRCLGEIGDPSVIPLLVETLAAEGELSQAARQALASLPRKEVGQAMLAALQERPQIRGPVIEVLKTLRYYEAIDPLVALARQSDPAVYDSALDGLRGIADPDDTDIPRLVKLLLSSEPGRHRDEVEKTILIVCQKMPAGADRAAPVLAALAKVDRAEGPKYLPLLGRLGGPKALAVITPALESPDAAAKDAAVRALCNWPNADVADRLLALATDSQNRSHRRAALRAYVRVVTLGSDRPEAETLAMLQEAMKLAASAEDRQLILDRAGTVRTMDSVEWIASYLDDAAVNQAACRAIVELAHHRFLRQPNMDRFGPLLDRVSTLSSDPQIVARAKRYRLGL